MTDPLAALRNAAEPLPDVGNAAFTEMGERDDLNIGQLVKERSGDAARLIGFGTHTGTVAAATDWDGPMEVPSDARDDHRSGECPRHTRGPRAGGEPRAAMSA